MTTILSSRNKTISPLFSSAAADPVIDTEKVEDLPSNDSDLELLKLRHTSAHVMAMAVQRIYPDAQVTIGPWIEDGFYYDFHFETGRKLTDFDLKSIKREMDEIISMDLPVMREEVTRQQAKDRIESIGEKFKLEILDGIKAESITIYSLGGEWWDLCAGPHVNSTGSLNPDAIELKSVAGAYWRGDEKREMLQRIYGTAWHTRKQLDAYNKRLEEARKRDHRVLGAKLDLFSIQEKAGGGLVFWHPKGSAIRSKLEEYWKECHICAGANLWSY